MTAETGRGAEHASPPTPILQGMIAASPEKVGSFFAFLLGVWPEKGKVEFLGIHRTFGTLNGSIQGEHRQRVRRFLVCEFL